MGAGPRRQSVGASRPDRLTLASRYLKFGYDLATGHWSLETTPTLPRLQVHSSSRVELLEPNGQIISRDLGDAALSSFEPGRSTNGEPVRRVRVQRTWSDGIFAIQTFELAADQPEFSTTLTVRMATRSEVSVRALLPICPPAMDDANLVTEPTLRLEHAIDVGWTATAPARRLSLVDRTGSPSETIATGLAVFGTSRDQHALTMAFLAAHQIIGEYLVADLSETTNLASQEPRFRLNARAWTGDVELGSDGVSSGPLWIFIGRVDEALTRFPNVYETPSRQNRPVSDVWEGMTRRPCNGQCAIWLRDRADSVDRSKVPAGRSRLETAPLDERAILAALASIASSELRRAFDVGLIPIGWQLCDGDWRPDPVRFPNGMRPLADAIRNQGLRPGVSIAPFDVERSSETFRSHPAWVLRYPTGDPIPIADTDGIRYVLDASQPAVREWLAALGRQVVQTWNFDVLRVECSDAVVSSGWRANGSVSPLEALRSGLAALRSGIGSRRLAVAGGPLFAVLDDVDLVETDRHLLTRADPSPLLRAFLNQLTTSIGAGPFLIGLAEQSVEEAQAAGTVACLAGGTASLGKASGSLPAERARILDACLPSLPVTVLPLDPFGPGGPRLFGARIRQRWEDWSLVVALNPTDHPIAVVATFGALGIAGAHHAFEFWTQSYLGIHSDRLTLESVPAGGCRVVALRPNLSVPQIVGTSFHVGMGSIDLQDVSRGETPENLCLTLAAPGDRAGTVTVTIPRGWAAGTVRGTGGSFALHPLGDRLLQIACRVRDVGEAQLTFWPTTR